MVVATPRPLLRPISPTVLHALRDIAHRSVLPQQLRAALDRFDMQPVVVLPEPGTRTALEHLQDVIDTIVGVGFVYGPLASRWDPAAGAYCVRGNWAAELREPRADVAREWRRKGILRVEDYPVGGACSTVAMLLAAAYTGAEEAYTSADGRSATKALLGPFYRPPQPRPGQPRPPARILPVWEPRWARPKGGEPYEYFPRKTSWPEIAEGKVALPADVNLILHAGHVVTLIRRREGLVHPLHRTPLRDHLVVAADGSYRNVDLDGDGERDERDYDGRPLVVEYLGVRARRKSREDKVSIVGLREPDPIPQDVRIIVG